MLWPRLINEWSVQESGASARHSWHALSFQQYIVINDTFIVQPKLLAEAITISPLGMGIHSVSDHLLMEY